MAELVFRVKADYEQAIKLREELNRLESEMKKVDASTKDGQDQLAQLTKEYSETGDKLKSIAEKAAEAGYVMSNEFGAKLADAKKQVIDLSVELVNAQKELDRLKNSGKATPQQIQDAEKKISDLSEALVKAEENYKDYTDSENKAGKGTKSLTEYSGAYNTIMRMLPGPIRSVVGGFRSLSGAALKFIATPLGAALLAVSAAFKGVSYWLNNTTSGMLAKQKWTKTLADTTEKWADKLGIVTKRMKELSDATASGAAAQITAYRSLQRQWEQANGVLEKQKEVLKSDEWKKLGISISGVNDAEDVLVSKSKNVVEAIMARARAAAMYQKIEKEIEEQIKREDTTKADNKRKEETKSEYQKTEREQERIVETFLQAQKDYIPSLGYSRDMKRGDDYYVTSSGERVYRNNLSDQAWREAILRNNRALRLSHGKARQDVGFFGRLGDNGLLPAGESYDILANLYEKELDLTRGRIENLDNQIKENNETIDSYLQDIIDQMGEADSLKGVANDILSNIGANGDTTAQDENTRAIEKKRRRDAEDVELATTTARISTMKDGTEKTIAQINLNKRKEEIAIRRAYEDLREKKIEEEKKAFESNPDNKNLTFTYDYNSDKYAPTVAEVKKFLAEKNAIEANAAKATKDALFQEEEAMYSYLKEYGNYWEKRLATVRHYNGLIERATTDGEKKRLENEKEDALNSLERSRVAFRSESGAIEDKIANVRLETENELVKLAREGENLKTALDAATSSLEQQNIAHEQLGKSMNDMFKGNVDLTKRPQIPATMLADAGWSDNGPSAQEIEDINSQIADIQKQIGDIVPQDAFENVTKLTGEIDEIKNKIVSIPGLDVLSADAIATLARYISMLNSLKDDKDKLVSEREDVSQSTATVYSMDFDVRDAGGEMHKILVTPILADGTVLSPDSLREYIGDTIDGADNLLSADNKGIIIGVDVKPGDGELLHKEQEKYYSFNPDSQEEVDVLTEEEKLLDERRRLLINQMNLRIAELEKERADKYGTKADQVGALRKLLDAQSALIKDDKQRDIFKAGGKVQLALAQYGNWQDYNTYDKAVEAAQKVYDAKKAELELREDNLGLMNLETQHANDLFNIELKFNKDLSTIFGNVSRYTKGQLANAKAIAQATLKAGKVNGQALTPNQIKDIQEALNGIIDAESELPFRSGNNDLFGIIKNVQILNTKQKELANMTDTTSLAYKKLAEEIEQRKEQLSLDTVATSVGSLISGLQTAADLIGQIGSNTNNRNLQETAKAISGVAEAAGSAMEGFSQGGAVAGVIALALSLGKQVISDVIAADAATEKATRSTEELYRTLRYIALDQELKDNLNSIFGSSFFNGVENAKSVIEKTGLSNMVDFILANDRANEYNHNNLERQRNDIEKLQDTLSGFRITTKYRASGFGGADYDTTTLAAIAKEAGMDLYDEYGNFNVELLQSILSTYDTLTEEEKNFINTAIADSEAYRDAIDQVKSSLSSLFSSTSSALADATIEGLHNGATMGAADMKRILSGTAKELQKSMVESIYAKYMSKFEDVMINGIMEKGWTEEDIMYQYSELLNNMGPTIQMAQNAARRMEEMGEAMGFDMSGLQNATPSQASYQTISETMGTAIDGRLTSLQISSGEQTGLLGMMNMSMSQMLEQVSNGARIADDVRNILTDSYLELVEIRKNTGDNVSELKLVKQMVATIEEHTRRL